MTLKDVYTADPQCVSPEAGLIQAAQKMKSLDVGMLPICENDRLVGTVTDRDITIRGIARGLDPKAATVREAPARKDWRERCWNGFLNQLRWLLKNPSPHQRATSSAYVRHGA